MPPGSSPYDLHTTIAACWRSRLRGPQTRPRSHWKTKVAYYRAVVEALSAAQGGPFTWRAVVDAVRPRGCNSTFYEVAGPRAKHSLIDAYREAGDADSLQIAYDYHRQGAIPRLIDEAKVWSFWEYREAYLRTYRDAGHLPAEAYTETLATWASLHQPLATALDFAPPACAVEDLIAVNRGRLTAYLAHQRLRDVVREAVLQPTDLATVEPMRHAEYQLRPASPVRPDEVDDPSAPSGPQPALLA